MAAPYFQKAPWTPFVHGGITYALSHLDEYHFTVTDSDAQDRRIAVTFSDHCFTREQKPEDDPALFYPGSRRKNGIFCFDRYQHSLGIAEHIAHTVRGKVWNASSYHDCFAIIPVINHRGERMLYAILFSLDRGPKDLPVDLHMLIRTAYPCDQKQIVTFGEIGFRKLVALRMKGKSPSRIMDRLRKTPRIL